MHISLDSALGQQRRLNQVGESITQIAPDPAAAYSLRSLTGSDPKVVRVRRGSDNHEQDFTASDVSSGALQDFVNAQVTAPLDIQALSATGRDGDFLIAKAAYSLRSLGTRQATLAATGDTVARADGKFVAQVRRNVDGNLKSFTATEVTDGTLLSFVNESFTSSLPLDVQGSAAAAYSLRNLSSSYSGNVVEVRRPSDDALKSFTAAEITDGTLLSFVTEEVTLVDATDFSSSLPSPLSTFNNGTLTQSFGQSIGGSDNTYLLERNSESTTGVLIRHLGTPNIFAGDTVTLTVEVFLPTSNTSTGIAFLISNLSSGNVHNIQITKGSWQTVTITGTMNSNGAANNFRVGTWIDASGNTVGAVGEKVYIRKYELKVKSSDGFVKTWYDQSGNSNNAVQATAADQPKIVSAGSLNADGGLLFDSSEFDLGSSVSLGSAHSIFAVAKTSTVRSATFPNLLTNPTNGRGVGLYADAITDKAVASSNDDNSFNFSSNTNRKIMSVTSDATNVNGFENGTASSDNTRSHSLTNNSFIEIGGGSNFAGTIEEIIVYLSDQSDNRRAIEESIASNYSITLSSSRDGFVKTWYDQSVTTQAGDTATGNHATQATAASQPKIVSAGSLLTAGVTFDGSDDHFDFTEISNTAAFSLFIASNITNNGGMVFGDNGGNGNYVRYEANDVVCKIAGSEYDFGDSRDTSLDIINLNRDGSNSLSANRNAAAIGSPQTATGTFDINLIGVRNNDVNPITGAIKELIIYSTDQTDNRTAIEANIGEAYSIDLPSGVDPGFDQVDGFVETWYDQSGNSNDVTQSTASKQPKIVNAGSLVTVNSRACINFDGTDDFLNKATYTQGALSQPNTAFTVAKLDAYTNTNRKIFDGDESTARNMLFLQDTGGGRFAYFAGNVRNTGEAGDADQHLFSAFYSASSSILRIDGTQKDTGNAGSNSMNGIVIAANHNTAYNFWDGDIQELIIYNSNETSNFTALETNINSHYSIF